MLIFSHSQSDIIGIDRWTVLKGFLCPTLLYYMLRCNIFRRSLIPYSGVLYIKSCCMSWASIVFLLATMPTTLELIFVNLMIRHKWTFNVPHAILLKSYLRIKIILEAQTAIITSVKKISKGGTVRKLTVLYVLFYGCMQINTV